MGFPLPYIVGGEIMRNVILSLGIVIASGVFASGIAVPDFSGTWIRDVARSDEMGTYMDGKIQTVSLDLVVRHVGTSLQVESKWSHKPATQVSYILDGTENTLTDERGNPFTYRATWNSALLIIEGTATVKTPFGNTEAKRKEEWSLSVDGRTLTVTSTAVDSTFGNSTRKQVYTKQV
jgi:hypothetical protein